MMNNWFPFIKQPSLLTISVNYIFIVGDELGLKYQYFIYLQSLTQSNVEKNTYLCKYQNFVVQLLIIMFICKLIIKMLSLLLFPGQRFRIQVSLSLLQGRLSIVDILLEGRHTTTHLLVSTCLLSCFYVYEQGDHLYWAFLHKSVNLWACITILCSSKLQCLSLTVTYTLV